MEAEPGDPSGLIVKHTAEYYNLMLSLIQMFEEIDINGDGTMEWGELLQFLMDSVNRRQQ